MWQKVIVAESPIETVKILDTGLISNSLSLCFGKLASAPVYLLNKTWLSSYDPRLLLMVSNRGLNIACNGFGVFCDPMY